MHAHSTLLPSLATRQCIQLEIFQEGVHNRHKNMYKLSTDSIVYTNGYQPIIILLAEITLRLWFVTGAGTSVMYSLRRQCQRLP